EGAVYLYGFVDGVQHCVGDRELDGGDLVAGRAGSVAVDHPRGVKGLEPCTADLGVELCRPVLDHLAVGERFAVWGDHPLVGALAHHVEGATGDADPAHAVVNPPRPQTLLGDGEAIAFGPEQVGLRHPARLVDDLGVAGVARPGVPHHTDVAHEVE